ncbi:CHAT domain-containing protein [Suillus bovinus]|uniref:CHAT domain-containing protein n=1 Tax=Suillus bovinus TaxID=48563 RepID=UPI001B876C3E|nr:CHAT domain-containing protein [Suillus bovinus]KAG2129724.1 CHAT domain-containing protein [Suillus bovinus]
MLRTRFERRGNEKDLDQGIALQTKMLALCPVGHKDRSGALNNLAVQLSARFDYRGNDEDLDQAIALHREALTLRPVGHTYRSMSLNNLANKLSTRFDRKGNDDDLDQAITLDREALALRPVALASRPVGHTGRSGALNNLANRLSTCFKHRGNDEDLNQAIALHREALSLCPIGHTDRFMSLNNLAKQLFTRFQHRGNDEDLDQAITLDREALALCPVGHTNRSTSLNNLANKFSTRFCHRGNDEDLDQAITLHMEALALHPVGHAHRPMSLDNLAIQLFIRFDHRGNNEDLDYAIALGREALALCPVGHTDRSGALNTLAVQLFTRFEYRGNDEDLDQAIALHREALNLCPAANVVPGGLLSRLRTSLLWVDLACRHSHATELEAYSTSMQLLDAYMTTTASVSSRHNIMKDFSSTLAVDAASCALRNGDVCRAVELLEQGRTLIWTQMTRLRTPLDSLQTHGDHAVALMKRFRNLSSLLDKPRANYSETTPRIRKIEGLSRFLLPPLFSDLKDAARDGPIIMLIASKSSCHAIIIPHKQPPASIQLSTNLEKLQTLVVKLQRTGSPAPMKALMELWDDVVRPVVENLGGIARRGSRIWWCPTSVFNFLPLHAAGEYRKDGQFLSQLYISSYTPSLTALIKARRYDRSLSVSFAAIGQNCPAGASFTLDCVEPELELVRSLLPPPSTVSFTKITSVDATKSRALRALQDNAWLHFSCHGIQKYEDPFNSAFLMRDQPLSLLDITQTDLSRHEFTFLCACETAVGDRDTPDEVIHLAAGLQFAGVKSVIGTLWKVNDSTVHRLVEAFYKNFCGDGTMNSKRAARALHRAVQSLARDTEIPLDQRIVFVHIGI